MSLRDLLLVVPDGPDFVAWARPHGEGRLATFGRATPGEPLPVRGGERVVLLAPGEEVTLRAIELPVRGGEQALAAARFAVEDDLAQPLEELEVALGPRGKTTRRELVVVSRERLSTWTATLVAVGVEADSATPDYAALPLDPGKILAVEHRERLLVRGEGLGFAVEAPLAPAILAAVLAERPAEAVTLLSDRPETLLPPALRDGRRVEMLPAPTDAELIALFVRGLVAQGPATAMNLAAKRSAAPVRLKDWRLAAGLSGAAAAAFLALLAAETVSFRAQAAAAEAAAGRVQAEAFADPADAASARSALRAGGGRAGASFLDLSALLAESVGDVPAMEIEALRFDAGGGGLAASVAFAAYEDVQRLRAAVETRGGRLTEGASRMQDDRLVGELTVERP